MGVLTMPLDDPMVIGFAAAVPFAGVRKASATPCSFAFLIAAISSASLQTLSTSTATFACSREATEAYDVVLSIGRGTSRARSTDKRSDLLHIM